MRQAAAGSVHDRSVVLDPSPAPPCPAGRGAARARRGRLRGAELTDPSRARRPRRHRGRGDAGVRLQHRARGLSGRHLRGRQRPPRRSGGLLRAGAGGRAGQSRSAAPGLPAEPGEWPLRCRDRAGQAAGGARPRGRRGASAAGHGAGAGGQVRGRAGAAEGPWRQGHRRPHGAVPRRLGGASARGGRAPPTMPWHGSSKASRWAP